MKQTAKLATIFLASFLLIGTYVFASFPVKTEHNQIITNEKVTISKNNIEQKIQTQFQTVVKKAENTKKANLPTNDEELAILVILWFFLGALAAHRWYKNKPIEWNILFILTAGGCGVWAIIDLIHILQGKF